MGESALKSHCQPSKDPAKKSKHESRLEDKMKSLHFQTTGSSSSSGSSKNQTIESLVLPVANLHAEIRWAMKVVQSHFSLRSCLDMNELFKTMFPDNQIASQFQMSKTKCSFVINFGLGPYFKDSLISKINDSPYFSLQFDESMNRVLQNEQMDAHIRYWCSESNEVRNSYFDSKFLLRPNCDNITSAIDDVLTPLEKRKMINLGMDGPSTNWAVLRKVQENRRIAMLSPLEDIGSCTLHILNGAIQTGLTKSSSHLKEVMKAMWKLFHDSPARRDEFIKVNGSAEFAHNFCPTRWTENQPVAEKALKLWEKYIEIIEYFIKTPKPNQKTTGLMILYVITSKIR